MTAKVLLRAKFDFNSADAEELPLKEGDVISLLFKDESGWAKGMKTTGEKGWFPIEYVDLANDLNNDDFVLEENVPKIPDSERTRYNIISEILQTEKTYLKNIIKIVKTFMTPLKEGGILDNKSIPKIFSNIEDIHNLNTKLFLELETRTVKWTETTLIGDVFSSAFDDFGAYEEYLKNHHTAILTVNLLREQKKNFALWLQTVKDQKESEGLDLLAYLIMPVQRILRYKLLLDDLAKNTKPEHPDFANISEAIKKIGDLAISVNESIKSEENYQTLLRIQRNFMGNVKNIVIEGRTFVREGFVTKVCRKSDKPRWFFLFNDILVYASAAVGSLNKKTGSAPRQSVVVSGTMGKRLMANQDDASTQKFIYHRMIPLKTTKVKALEDTLSLKNAFQIITTEEKSFVVYTESQQEKDAWVRDITKYSSSEDITDSAPVWIPDREAKTCMCCTKAFNVVNRRHHCRYCGKVVCGGCSPQSIKTSLSAKAVRVCKICYEDFKKGELKDISERDSFTDSTTSSRSSMISSTGIDFESDPDNEADINESNRNSGTGKPRMGTNSSARMLAPTRTISTPNLGNNKETEKSRESGNFPIVTQSVSAELLPSSNSPTSPNSASPVTSPNGTARVPPKPASAKPQLKPKPSTLTESDLIKKRIEYLTKALEDETLARANLEKTLQLEITELRRENIQLREEMEDIKLRILPILEKSSNPKV